VWDIRPDIWRENHVNPWEMPAKLWLHWAGLREQRRSSVFGSRVTVSQLYSGKRWRRASLGSRRPLLESAVLLLGGLLLLCALQMLSRSKSSSDGTDWLTGTMWSASLSAVDSGARPIEHWHCCGPIWLANACFLLPVYQKLVVGLEMRCGGLPQIYISFFFGLFYGVVSS
jgi:hypothetical protein